MKVTFPYHKEKENRDRIQKIGVKEDCKSDQDCTKSMHFSWVNGRYYHIPKASRQ